MEAGIRWLKLNKFSFGLRPPAAYHPLHRSPLRPLQTLPSRFFIFKTLVLGADYSRLIRRFSSARAVTETLSSGLLSCGSAFTTLLSQDRIPYGS